MFVHSTTEAKARLNSAPQKPISNIDFHRLASLDTCTVANTFEQFHPGLRNEGFTTSNLHCWFPDLAPLVGYALTLKIRTWSPPPRGEAYSEDTSWWEQIATAPGPRVLVIEDVDPQPGRGSFLGSAHARIFQSLGCVGVITNGAVRELNQIGPLQLPLFSGSLSVSHAYSHVVQIGEAVLINGLLINSGDLLHGDQHGLINVPQEILPSLPEAAVRLKEINEQIQLRCQERPLPIDALRRLLLSR